MPEKPNYPQLTIDILSGILAGINKAEAIKASLPPGTSDFDASLAYIEGLIPDAVALARKIEADLKPA